jgi:hypothetical protein
VGTRTDLDDMKEMFAHTGNQTRTPRSFVSILLSFIVLCGYTDGLTTDRSRLDFGALQNSERLAISV